MSKVTFSDMALERMRRFGIAKDVVDYAISHFTSRQQGDNNVYRGNLRDGRELKVLVNERGVIYNVIPITEGEP